MKKPAAVSGSRDRSLRCLVRGGPVGYPSLFAKGVRAVEVPEKVFDEGQIVEGLVGQLVGYLNATEQAHAGDQAAPSQRKPGGEGIGLRHVRELERVLEHLDEATLRRFVHRRCANRR